MSVGRQLTIEYLGVVFAAIQTKSIKVNKEAIDVTNDDSSGFKTFATEAGTMSLDISFDGLAMPGVLRDIGFSPNSQIMLENVVIRWPDGGAIYGNFIFPSYEESGSHNDAVKFSGELNSSGPWIYTS